MRLDKICRACLCEGDNMICMVEKKIFKKFLAFTDLPVQKEILNVSLNLCQSCEEKLNISCAFKEKCLKSHQMLLCHVNNAEALQIGCDEQEDVEEDRVETDNRFQSTATIKQDEVEESIVTTDNDNLQLIAADDGKGIEEPPVTIGMNIVQPPRTTNNKHYLALQKFSPHDVLQAIEKLKRYRYANIKCNYCKFVPINFGSLCIHMSRIHKDLKQNWCHLCNEVYEDLTIHTEIRHPEDLTCTFCKLKFPQEIRLYTHLRRHSGVELFPCRYCEKFFFLRFHLDRHLRIHKRPHSGSSKRSLSLRSKCRKSFIQRSHHSDLPPVTTSNNIFQSIATDEEEGCEEPLVTTDNIQIK